jgi:histidinol dehydrogenase
METARLHDLSGSNVIPPSLLERTETDLSEFIEKAGPIIAAVRTEGDAALQRLARSLEGVTATNMSIRVEPAEFETAMRNCPPDVVRAIEHAIDNIRRYHESQMPKEMWLQQIEPGIWVGERHTPIDSVACYVPRGKGSFPSVVNMTAIPGKVAGVPRLVILTPPGPDGSVDAGTLVAAQLAGVTEVYKCGGAQAVAAVAYGTQTVPRCLKIIGPGSPWVVAAKRLLADRIDPGTPAGPSESIVLADDSADGALAALDLLIEAEHGPDSSAFLVTPSRRVAGQAQAALQGYWQRMEPQRVQYSKAVLGGEHGGIVLTRDFEAAIAFCNAYGPEHMAVLAADPMSVLPRLRNAGEIMLGQYSAISLANYVLGINAVLPTGGNAMTSSPLSVFDYLKRTSVAHVSKDGYARVAPDTHCLARYEGFDAHARAVSALRTPLMHD